MEWLVIFTCVCVFISGYLLGSINGHYRGAMYAITNTRKLLKSMRYF